METNLNQPQIEFTWPSETLEDILGTLGIEGLGSFNEETGFFSSWPTSENWFLYTIRLAGQMPMLLKDEIKNIEEKLSAVETTFDQHLSGLNSANDPEISKELRQLTDKLAEIEKLICERDSHEAYPYFARWFTLNLAVLSLLMKYENRYAQVRGVKLWFSGKYYLDRVIPLFYGERVDQINLQYTGALNDRVYVRDYRENLALTFDVPCGGEEDVELRELHLYLRRYIAWQHIQEIRLPENYNILVQAIAALSVTENSNIKQDQVLSVDSVWSEKHELILKQITDYQERCGDVIEKLINSAAAYLLQPTSGYIEVVAFRSAGDEDKKDKTKEKLSKKFQTQFTEKGKAIGESGVDFLTGKAGGTEFALTVMQNAIQGVASFIPGGTAISLMTGLVFKFLMQKGEQNKTDPMVALEERLKSFITDQAATTYLDDTQGTLNTNLNKLKSLMADLSWSDQEALERTANLRQLDIFSLETGCDGLLERILGTDATNKYYSYTFPLIQRFVLLYLLTTYITEALGYRTEAYILSRKKRLYHYVFDYIAKACPNLGDYRASKIQFNYYPDCVHPTGALYDEMNKTNVAEYSEMIETNLRDGMLEMARATSRVIYVEQCLRNTIRMVKEIYQSDVDIALEAARELEEKGLLDKVEQFNELFNMNLNFAQAWKETCKTQYYKTIELRNWGIQLKSGSFIELQGTNKRLSITQEMINRWNQGGWELFCDLEKEIPSTVNGHPTLFQVYEKDKDDNILKDKDGNPKPIEY